jgi:hypothetical protein
VKRKRSHKKGEKIGGHGGERDGAGRKDVLTEAVTTYQKLGRLRLPEDADPETISLVTECRQKMLDIMRKPTRHAQSQIQVAKYLIEEACGKVSEELKISEHSVTVNIVKNAKPEEPMKELPAGAKVIAITAGKKEET